LHKKNDRPRKTGKKKRKGLGTEEGWFQKIHPSMKKMGRGISFFQLPLQKGKWGGGQLRHCRLAKLGKKENEKGKKKRNE